MSYNTIPSLLTGIGDAIREKTGTTNVINAQDMPQMIQNIETGIDTSDATATADNMAKGKTAYVNGEKITGNLEEITTSSAFSIYGQVEVVGSNQARIASYVNIPKGINSSKRTTSSITNLPAIPAMTITPGYNDLIAVPKDCYATGNITVTGDANLIPSNIKKGTSIFGVYGSLSSAKLYTGTVSSFYNKGSGAGGYLTFAFNETLPSTIYALEIHYIDKLYTSDWYMHSLSISIPEGIAASSLTGTSKTSIPGYCVCKDEDNNTYYGWTYLSFQEYGGNFLKYYGVGRAVLDSSSSQTIKYFPIMLLNNDSSATYELECNILGA